MLIEGGSFVRYSPTGHLIYSREGELLAVPFDAGRLEVTGPPTRLLDGVSRETSSGAVHFGISRDGTLMYVPESTTSSEATMVWVDRDGRVEPILRTLQPFLAPRLSPDGQRLAVGVGPGAGDGDIWVHDLVRAKPTRLTFESDYVSPIWTPDGKRVVFGVTRGGSEGIGWKAADGGDAEEMIFREESGAFVAEPEAWLPDGTILYAREGGGGSSDVMAAVPGESIPRPILAGPSRDGGVSLSPSGRWMAYSSNESGRFEVYVRPFPESGGKWQLSTEGGKGPVWSRDGREIFFTDGNRMMVVPVEIEPTFSHGVARRLFELEFHRGYGPWPDYDASPDGKRFLMFQRSRHDEPRRQIDIVTDLKSKLVE
jgi:serine/threonine-protein kinase